VTKELPHTATCPRCGAAATIPRQSIDEDAAIGQLPGFDQAWEAGFWYTLESPNCGRLCQQLDQQQDQQLCHGLPSPARAEVSKRWQPRERAERRTAKAVTRAIECESQG
jgi:hypothetical protein